MSTSCAPSPKRFETDECLSCAMQNRCVISTSTLSFYSSDTLLQTVMFVPLVNSYQGSILFKFLKSVTRSDATTEKDRSDRSFSKFLERTRMNGYIENACSSTTDGHIDSFIKLIRHLAQYLQLDIDSSVFYPVRIYEYGQVSTLRVDHDRYLCRPERDLSFSPRSFGPDDQYQMLRAHFRM